MKMINDEYFYTEIFYCTYTKYIKRNTYSHECIVDLFEINISIDFFPNIINH